MVCSLPLLRLPITSPSHLHCFQCALWPAHHSTHLSSHAYRTCVVGTPPPPFLAWGSGGRRFACAHPCAGGMAADHDGQLQIQIHHKGMVCDCGESWADGVAGVWRSGGGVTGSAKLRVCMHCLVGPVGRRPPLLFCGSSRH